MTRREQVYLSNTALLSRLQKETFGFLRNSQQHPTVHDYRYRDANMLERRELYRFVVHAPVIFCWKSRGLMRVAEAETSDISARGMYLATRKCPPRNATVRCQVLLPSLAADKETGTRMVANAVGKVLRTERAASRHGFAITHETFVLRDQRVSREQWKKSVLRLWRTA